MKSFVMVFGVILMSLLTPAAGFSETPATMGETEVSPGKPAAAAGKENKAVPQPFLERRWILKMKKEKPMPPAKKTDLSWKNEEQKSRCETLRKDLRVTFKNTRYYSIHGDACNTGASAGLFLKAMQQCSQECPAGFPEQNGYTRTVRQNVEKLLELGNKRCLELPSTDVKIKDSPEKRP